MDTGSHTSDICTPEPAKELHNDDGANLREGPSENKLTLTPPKKSARLAEKRKIREEAGPSSSSVDSTYYFTPYKIARQSSARSCSESSSSEISPSKPIRQAATTESDEEKDHTRTTVASTSSTESQNSSNSKANEKTQKTDPDFNESQTHHQGSIDAEKSNKEANETTMTMTFDYFEDSSPPEMSSSATEKIQMIRARIEKARRRRLQAQQKRESDKKRTVDRLLRKHNNSSKHSSQRHRSIPKSPADPPVMITYVIGRDRSSISFPDGYDISLLGGSTTKASTTLKAPTEPILCGVEGCHNPKKYNCSKTKIPLCSLECYKINLESRQYSILSENAKEVT